MKKKLIASISLILATLMIGGSTIIVYETPQKTERNDKKFESVEDVYGKLKTPDEAEETEEQETVTAAPLVIYDEIGFVPGQTTAGEWYDKGFLYVPSSYYYENNSGIRLSLGTIESQVCPDMGLSDDTRVWKIVIDVESSTKIPKTDILFGMSVDDIKKQYGEPTRSSEYGKYLYLTYEYDEYTVDLKVHNKKGLISISVDALPIIYG